MSRKPATVDHKLAIMGTYFVREARSWIAAIEEQMARPDAWSEFFLAGAFNLMLERGARFTTSGWPSGRTAGAGPPETNRGC